MIVPLHPITPLSAHSSRTEHASSVLGKLVDVYREGRGNVALSPFENAPHMTKEAYERASH